MFDEFVKQCKRIFSSKTNNGKLAHPLTYQLHYYKVLLLAGSIVVLLGYSQFREHFQCQSRNEINEKALTNFCWLNGTTTINDHSVNDDASSVSIFNLYYDINIIT